MNRFDRDIDRRNTGSMKWDRYAGTDILPFWVADMDFRSPLEVMEALKARAEHGVFGYTVPHQEATDEVVAYLKRVHGRTVDPGWLVWLPGVVQALNLCCRIAGEPGDAVMVNTPAYPPFLTAPGWQDRELITVPLAGHADEWAIDFDAMEAAVTPRTKLFILCNPQNPVGRVYRLDELERVADFCLRHGLILCSDEIHCDLVLDEAPHIPTAALGPEVDAITLTLLSPSKTYNLPGLSFAYAVIPDSNLRAAFRKVSRGMVTEMNAFGWTGCRAAYAHGEPWRLELITYLRENRDYLYAFIAAHFPEIRMKPMQATYLAWLDMRETGVEHPHRLFEEAGVGLSDGRDFGMPGFLRFNFGCTRAMLEEGLRRMKTAWEGK